jgi:putative effector of murein hydrolase
MNINCTLFLCTMFFIAYLLLNNCLYNNYIYAAKFVCFLLKKKAMRKKLTDTNRKLSG